MYDMTQKHFRDMTWYDSCNWSQLMEQNFWCCW